MRETEVIVVEKNGIASVTRTVKHVSFDDLNMQVDEMIENSGFGRVMVELIPSGWMPSEDERAILSGIEGGTWPEKEKADS